MRGTTQEDLVKSLRRGGARVPNSRSQSPFSTSFPIARLRGWRLRVSVGPKVISIIVTTPFACVFQADSLLVLFGPFPVIRSLWPVPAHPFSLACFRSSLT
jgi:hypothetical protein